MEYLIGGAVLLVLALIPAEIARRKGQGFWTYYIFGVMLWLVAMVVVLLVKDRRPRCPECREVVHPEASRCPHCRSEIAGRAVVEDDFLSRPFVTPES